MKKILYISCLAPYDEVAHAGGKVHNFYIKKMQATEKYDISLLSMCWGWEEKLLDLDKYGIKNDIYVLDKNELHKLARKVLSGFSYFNPFDKYVNLLLDYERYQYKKLIRKYVDKCRKNQEKKPDIIILQWTQMIFLIDYVKKFFPDSKIIAIEEDVSFLNFKRRVDLRTNILYQKIADYRYQKIKKMELMVLKKADIVVTNNHKDYVLLEQEGIECGKLRELPVFFKNYEHVKRIKKSKEILYYGAMARPENFNSALWFIDNVMPLIEDQEVKFVIVGSRPDKKLLERESDRVIVTGFVDTIEPFFSECCCMVAPLVLGAGVKVKILEAMSSGIQVLTNDIGIEGIYATDGKEYSHCITPLDYAKRITEIINAEKTVDNVNAKRFIKENYNLDEAFEKFMLRELD